MVLFIYVKKGDSKENASNNANINVNNAPAVGTEFGSTPVNTNNSNNEQGE